MDIPILVKKERFMFTELKQTVPAGLNFLVAALVGVALAMSQIKTDGFVFFLIGSGVFLVVGILSLWLKAKETARVDLVIKTVLLLLIAGGMVFVHFEPFLVNPYAPLRAVQHTLTASLVLLGILVADRAIREWGGVV